MMNSPELDSLFCCQHLTAPTGGIFRLKARRAAREGCHMHAPSCTQQFVRKVSHSVPAPVVTASVPVNESCEAYLHLKGVIDPAKETERLLAKKSKVEVPVNNHRQRPHGQSAGGFNYSNSK